jgi:hypothetical protein
VLVTKMVGLIGVSNIERVGLIGSDPSCSPGGVK